jgi:hypothetical protein
VVQTKAYATVVSVGTDRPPVYQVGAAAPTAASGSVRGRRPLQVELGSDVIEAFPEAELIGLPEELSKWLCVPARPPD